ncbi:MAG TPA: hemerythrin domain-containing protein [Candidatus Binatia bacterium]|jgi:hemerythrin-like domain-containing protein|nr:hemerythrin domain-containing protein [Candidatus Binatia bacterium]
MIRKRIYGRRRFLLASSVFGTDLLLAQWARISKAAEEKEKNPNQETGEEVSPAEDLMREHGVLDRILLIYEDILARVHDGKEFPPEVLTRGANLVRRFIEDYHEKLEEDSLFPRFEKAGKLVELVQVLRQQHQAGRRVTAAIQQLSTPTTLKDPDARQQLGTHLRHFIRMYRPHAAREDTVLFPAFHALVTPREYAALGDQFEDKEHDLFGANGFEQVVDQVANLEKQLGLYELAQFTPSRPSDDL